MNVTKNKLIEALNLLGEFPEKSLKKEELIKKLNKMYDPNIRQLVIIINVRIYDLLKELVNADRNGINVEIEYEPEVNFLQEALIIEEPIINKKKRSLIKKTTDKHFK